MPDPLSGARNLQLLLTQEKIFEEISSGGVRIDYILHNSVVRGVRVYGKKKYLYNRSEVDENNNEKALRDIVSRIADGLENGHTEKVDFTVNLKKKNILSIEWKSQKDKRFDK